MTDQLSVNANVVLMRKKPGIIWPSKTFNRLCYTLMFNANSMSQPGLFRYMIKADMPGPVCHLTLYPDGRSTYFSDEHYHPMQQFANANMKALLSVAPRLRSTVTLVGKVSVATNPAVFVVYYLIQDGIADVSTQSLKNYDVPCLVHADSTDVLSITATRQQVECPSIPSSFVPHVDLIAFPTDIDSKEEAKVNPAFIEAIGFRMYKGTHAWTHQT